MQNHNNVLLFKKQRGDRVIPFERMFCLTFGRSENPVCPNDRLKIKAKGGVSIYQHNLNIEQY